MRRRIDCKHIIEEIAIVSQRLQLLLALNWLYPQSTVFSHVTHIFPQKKRRTEHSRDTE